MHKTYPVGITCSDIHLCHTAPPCRSKESDWYMAMKRSIDALKRKRDELGEHLPIIMAGDLFDKWNPPHELVNFALANLPHVYGVPGQHDLPYHSYSDIKKSAYWTLVEAGRITNLEYNKPTGAGELYLHGFPWGSPLAPIENGDFLCLDIAVVHHFIFTSSTGYPGAKEECRAKAVREKLKGFDVAVFGDNHKGFTLSKKESLPAVINNGVFMRRRSDEENYQPSMGVIYSDGSVERVPLEVEEVFNRVEQDNQENTSSSPNFRNLINQLGNLTEVSGDFREEIKRELARREPNPSVQRILWQAME
jgi:DNA repair exonuclease SbcCD nuclease subunit